jgi:hypothetical protein
VSKPRFGILGSRKPKVIASLRRLYPDGGWYWDQYGQSWARLDGAWRVECRVSLDDPKQSRYYRTDTQEELVL